MDSPLNRRVRAFLGIGPPPEEWLDALEEWLLPVKRRLQRELGSKKGIKWTARENLHVTMRFFGSISQADVLAIQEGGGLISSKFKPLEIDASHLAFFSSIDRPRIVALDCWDEARQVNDLENEFRSAFAEIGQAPENRPSRPHLTLARINFLSRQEHKVLRDLHAEDAGPKLPEWIAREVTLFESKLQPSGSVYSALAKSALAS